MKHERWAAVTWLNDATPVRVGPLCDDWHAAHRHATAAQATDNIVDVCRITIDDGRDTDE